MTHHLIPVTTYFDSSGYRARWHVEASQLPIVCDHEVVDVFLCGDCASTLGLLLEDLPALVFDLALASTRQTRFVDHGSSASETALPFDAGASASLSAVQGAVGALRGLLGRPRATVAELRSAMPELLVRPDIVAAVRLLSDAVLQALRVIDRPPDPWYFGPCPGCQADLFGDRETTHVTCLLCGYAAKLADHQLAALDHGDARMLTVTELVGAITSAGETVTRDQINGWIRREGLVREVENRPSWRKGQLVSHEVFTYRLGDVRRLALKAEGC